MSDLATFERNAKATLAIKLTSPHADLREAARAEMAEHGWSEAECQAAAKSLGFAAGGGRAPRVDPADPLDWSRIVRRMGDLARRS